MRPIRSTWIPLVGSALTLALAGCSSGTIHAPPDQAAGEVGVGEGGVDMAALDGISSADRAFLDSGRGREAGSSDGRKLGEAGRTTDGGGLHDGAKTDHPSDTRRGDTFFLCHADGTSCLAPSDCCSGSCSGSVCVTPTCLAAGATCVSSAECCSGSCSSSGTCQATATCGLTGSGCTAAADCCSLYCSGGKCATGAICKSSGATCSSNVDCCSNICTGSLCQALASGCGSLGDSCTGAGGCCSNNCVTTSFGMVCEPSNYCRSEGDICFASADCCAGNCVIAAGATSGYCELSTGGCTPDGEPCTGGATVCCTNQCDTTSYGVAVCTAVSGCRPIGEACSTAAECCGGLCAPDSHGFLRCKFGGTCLPEGDVCHIGSSVNCCHPGGGSGSAYCLPAPGSTVSRCYGACLTEAGYMPYGSTPGCCIPLGDVCTFSGECCGGAPCVPDSTGTLRCGSSCKSNGETCTSSSECCDGSCYLGVCRLPPPPPPDAGIHDAAIGVEVSVHDAGVKPDSFLCLADGSTCTLGSMCCSGSCIGGICGTITCITSGGTCTTNADCCSGLTCISGKCGVACSGTGVSCTSGSQCCSGLCSGGSCTFG